MTSLAYDEESVPSLMDYLTTFFISAICSDISLLATKQMSVVFTTSYIIKVDDIDKLTVVVVKYFTEFMYS